MLELLETVDVPLAVVDRSRQGALAFETVNRQFASLIGVDAVALVGRPVGTILPDAVLAGLVQVAASRAAAVVHAALALGPERQPHAVMAQPLAGPSDTLPRLLVSFLRQPAIEVSTDTPAAEAMALELLDMQSEMVSRWLPDGTIIYCNEAFAAQCTRSRAELIGARLADLTPADEMAQITANVARLSPGRPTSAYDHRIVLPNGEECWQAWIDRALYDGEGHLLGYLSVGRDISARKAAERRLAVSEQRLKFVLEAGGFGICETELDRERVTLDATCAARLGYRPSPLTMSLAEVRTLIHPEDRQRVCLLHESSLSAVGSRCQAEYRIRHCEGRWLWLDEQVLVVEAGADDKPRRILGVSADVTPRKQAEQRLAHLAQHDELTGLPNRRALANTLAQALTPTEAPRRLAVFMLDLDGFKGVNDRYGHETGDRVLVEVARQLRNSVRSQDLVARLGGDEFAIVAEPIRPGTAQRLARRIRASVRETCGALGLASILDVSIGIALYPNAGETFEALLASADRALYAAKRERTGWRFSGDISGVALDRAANRG